MKRTIALLSFLVAVMGISAQSLIGTWSSKLDKEEVNGTLLLTFNNNSTMKAILSTPVSESEDGTNVSFNVNLFISGAYSKINENLTWKWDKRTFSVKVENVQIQGEFEGMESVFEEMLQSEMEKQKDELFQSLSELCEESLTIKSLTTTQLVIHEGDNGEGMVFTRVKAKSLQMQ